MTVLSESDRWRQKYFDKLAASEQEETRLKQRVRTYQTLLEQLRRAAAGLDQQLDGELLVLGTLLHSDTEDSDGLGELARRLEPSVRHLEQRRQADAEAFLVALRQLVDQLLACGPAVEQQRALDTFAAGLQANARGLQACPQLLVEFGVLLARALQTLAATAAAPSRPGFFERLFGAVAGENGTGVSVPVTVAATGEPCAGKESVDLARMTAQLQFLLDQLPAPSVARDDRERIRGRLDACRDEGQLAPLLETITAWVLDAFARVQREFEAVLSAIDSRLRELQRLLEQSQASQERSRDNNTELETAMQRHVGDLKSSVEKATDLDSLKRSIDTRLTSILDSVAQFMDREAERELAADRALLQLRTRLQQMEADTRELKRQATTDSLSGLPNRAAYGDRVRREFERRQQRPGGLTLVVMDIDKLKPINDRFGHLAGDKVIQLVAREVAGMLRPTDFIARYGGEEFVILLPDTPREAAAAAMERVRWQVAQLPFHFRDQSIRVTVSMGICEFADGCSVADVFECADQALYRAKRLGRDRVEVAAPPQRATAGT